MIEAVSLSEGSDSTDETDGSMPPAIRAFERIQITAIVVGWMNATVAYHEAFHFYLNSLVFTGVLSAISALVFMLMARASRGRCNVSRWLLIAASGLLVAPWFGLLLYISPFNINGLLLMMQGGLQFAACAILLGETAHVWFATPEEAAKE